jgi:hypothetical protein
LRCKSAASFAAFAVSSAAFFNSSGVACDAFFAAAASCSRRIISCFSASISACRNAFCLSLKFFALASSFSSARRRAFNFSELKSSNAFNESDNCCALNLLSSSFAVLNPAKDFMPSTMVAKKLRISFLASWKNIFIGAMDSPKRSAALSASTCIRCSSPVTPSKPFSANPAYFSLIMSIAAQFANCCLVSCPNRASSRVNLPRLPSYVPSSF